MRSVAKDSISLAYWNIDGLYSRAEGQKLENDVFLSCVKNFDIICLVETHCGPNEQLLMEGYRIYIRTTVQKQLMQLNIMVAL